MRAKQTVMNAKQLEMSLALATSRAEIADRDYRIVLLEQEVHALKRVNELKQGDTRKELATLTLEIARNEILEVELDAEREIAELEREIAELDAERAAENA